MAVKEAETKLSGLTEAPPGGWTFEVTFTAPSGEEKKLVVDGASPRRMVGKSALCQLVVDDPEVSRRHATVESTRHGLHLQDLGSKNGTFVAGVRVASAFLLGGETVRIGKTDLHVRRVDAPETTLVRTMRMGRVVGASDAMRKLYPILKRLADSDVPVILSGPTGTGKELVAETLHEEGARRHGPFITVDCAALTPARADEVLFGGDRPGAFAQAENGTLFFDEIGDLDPALQAKLLGVLERTQSKTDAAPAAVDVRIMASTRRDLEVEVQEGRFREDLYYRLAVTEVELPPLAERQGDVELLVRHFWSKLGGPGELAAATVQRLARSEWPGNVRELRNAVARIIAVGDGGVSVAGVGDASAESATTPAPRAGGDFDRVLAMDLTLPVARQKVVDEFERLYLERALAKSGGNVSAAAMSAGIARRYFYVLKNRLSTNEE